MERLPVIHKTKLTKEQTYFVHTSEISEWLSDSVQFNNLALQFSDDPSRFKSNYDRFVKQEGKLVILSARYTPSIENREEEGERREYLITVYAILKDIRDDLRAQFEKVHFNTLIEWVNEPRDNVWRNKPHAIQFLIDIDTEEVGVAHDIDFDSYSRHSKKQRFRVDGRNH